MIGPMVICGVVIRGDAPNRLAEIGVKDSKALSPARRESLYTDISAVVERVFVPHVLPSQIDADNLNTLGAIEIGRMITEAQPDEVYLDAPVVRRGIPAYCQKLRALLPDVQFKLVAENKADEKYPIVAAASIIAKVTRDEAIRKLHGQYGYFGSGYPSDPRTVEFLTQSYEQTGAFPEIVRQKWLTVRRLVAGEQTMISFPD